TTVRVQALRAHAAHVIGERRIRIMLVAGAAAVGKPEPRLHRTAHGTVADRVEQRCVRFGDLLIKAVLLHGKPRLAQHDGALDLALANGSVKHSAMARRLASDSFWN